jgi:DNA modification methylase
MVVKVLKKMEVLRGFIQIPMKSRLELIGSISSPCVTLLNGNKARLDKYGRLWSNWLKGRFRVGSRVRLSRNGDGFQIETVKEDSLENVLTNGFENKGESLGSVGYGIECLKKFKKLDDIWVPKIIVGDIRKVVHRLPDNFIDCIITSPPYWMQRDYSHPEQIGREETPEKYVEEIVTVFQNLRPKLKKTATVFLNVGYKYLNGEFLLIPEMIALKMRERGFILKNKIIWWKPNAMPTPARDRLNDVYEPVLFFIRDDGKEVHYFNLEEISERPKTLDNYTRLLSISPKELLGVKVVDPLSMRENKEGRVVGVRFISNYPVEVLIKWKDESEEWLPFGETLKNYPEKASFICPLCKGIINFWNIMLSFANLGKLVCPECQKDLCEEQETFPLPNFNEVKQYKNVQEIIDFNAKEKKYITKVPRSSKFLKANMNEISMASPAGRLAIGGEYLTIKRRWDVPQLLIAEYLRYWRVCKGVTIEDVDKMLGYAYTAGHWFRRDFGWWGKGGSIPRPNDWKALKNLLKFNDIYDRLVSEVVAVLQTVKPHEEGRNPGDVWEIMLEQYPEAHFSIFPTKLVEVAMKAGCPPEGVVLDPFAGSGTVGEVAIKLNRKAILVELIPEFIGLIRKRCKGKVEIYSIN